MPSRRASAMSSRCGYIPGSCSNSAAMNASGWWVFSHADWYVGIANAAPWALQKPKEPKAARISQTLSITSTLYPFESASRLNAFSKIGSFSGFPIQRRYTSARASPHPVMVSMMRRTCSWNTTTPWVSFRIGARSGCGTSVCRNPWRCSRNGVTMSDCMGPGRNREMSMMRSLSSIGASFPMSSRCPGDSIWKMPSVLVVRIISNVVSSSNGIRSRLMSPSGEIHGMSSPASLMNAAGESGTVSGMLIPNASGAPPPSGVSRTCWSRLPGC